MPPSVTRKCPREGRMARLDEKAAIVTGAASGIGRASALLFAREGARLIVVDRNVDGLNETVDVIARDGGRAEAVTADVSSDDDVAAFVERALTSFGTLDIVYANAGILGGPTP